MVRLAPGTPLVYASIAATYGDGTQGFDDATPPDRLTPLNLYGKSKNDFDRWALAELAAGGPRPQGATCTALANSIRPAWRASCGKRIGKSKPRGA